MRFSSGDDSAMKGTIIVLKMPISLQTEYSAVIKNRKLDKNVRMINKNIKSIVENTKWRLATD